MLKFEYWTLKNSSLIYLQGVCYQGKHSYLSKCCLTQYIYLVIFTDTLGTAQNGYSKSNVIGV